MYRLAVIENEEIKKQVQELLEKGAIRPSTYPCGSPIVLVPKRGSTWTICVDFQTLNKITMKNIYPLPRIDDLLDQLKNATYFTKLDLRSCYHQIRIFEDDIWKKKFKTKQCFFDWLVMPYVICNAPATFICIMNDVFRPFIDDFVFVYLDNIPIFSKFWEDHVKRVREGLDVLKNEKMCLKMSKC
jgi:hypothetical protein